jgi:hypothetical protein
MMKEFYRKFNNVANPLKWRKNILEIFRTLSACVKRRYREIFRLIWQSLSLLISLAFLVPQTGEAKLKKKNMWFWLPVLP